MIVSLQHISTACILSCHTGQTTYLGTDQLHQSPDQFRSTHWMRQRPTLGGVATPPPMAPLKDFFALTWTYTCILWFDLKCDFYISQLLLVLQTWNLVHTLWASIRIFFEIFFKGMDLDLYMYFIWFDLKFDFYLSQLILVLNTSNFVHTLNGQLKLISKNK